MRASLRRLSIAAMICFFPLAIAGLVQEKKSLRLAIRLYYASVFIFIIFLCFLALYTYIRGGNFIRPLGTFY